MKKIPLSKLYRSPPRLNPIANTINCLRGITTETPVRNLRNVRHYRRVCFEFYVARKFNNLLFLRFSLIIDFRRLRGWDGAAGAFDRNENSNRRLEWSLFYVSAFRFCSPIRPLTATFAIYFAIVFAPPDPAVSFVATPQSSYKRTLPQHRLIFTSVEILFHLIYAVIVLNSSKIQCLDSWIYHRMRRAIEFAALLTATTPCINVRKS